MLQLIHRRIEKENHWISQNDKTIRIFHISKVDTLSPSFGFWTAGFPDSPEPAASPSQSAGPWMCLHPGAVLFH